ncbi:hypothetical protein JXQ70_13615 [bacterium]|nr:hypothetical protein [bacterium]
MLGKNKYCIQCGKLIETSFQTKYCSRKCWEEYKKEHSLSVAPERQATVFLKAGLGEEEQKFENDDDVRIVPLDKAWKSLSDKNDQVEEQLVRGKAEEEKTGGGTLRKEYVEFLKRRLTEKEVEVRQLNERVHELEEKLAEAQNKLRTVDTAKMVPPLFEEDEEILFSDEKPAIELREEESDTDIPKPRSWLRRFLGR